jgi:hypothetical protein
LFLFLCREAEDEINAEAYIYRLDRAIRDIQAVQAAFENDLDAPAFKRKGGRSL